MRRPKDLADPEKSARSEFFPTLRRGASIDSDVRHSPARGADTPSA